MTPHKAKELIDNVAERVNNNYNIVVTNEECKQVIDVFYKILKDKMSTLDYPTIEMEGLGKFYIKEKYALDKLKTFKDMINCLSKRPSSTRVNLIIASIEEQIKKIERMLKILSFEKDKRRLMYEYKKYYADNKHIKDTEDYKRTMEDFKLVAQSYVRLPRDKENFKAKKSNL